VRRMNTLSNPLEENQKNTLKSHEIKLGKSFRLGEENHTHNDKIDVTNDSFLQKLTPELSNKIKETIAIAEQKAQSILVEAQNQAEELRQQALQQGIQEGIIEGQNQGYQDGYNQALNEFREKIITVDRLISNITNAKSQIYHSGEDELLEFVMILAEKLAHTQITFDKNAIKNIIIDASAELKEKETVKVLIHPSLAQKIYSIADEIKDAIYGLKNLKIIEDRTISPDGIVIESPESRIDARLETQVETLMEILMKEKNKTPLLEEDKIDVEPDSI